MASTPVTGTGPIAITTDDNAHLTIPLSALSFENGAVKVSAAWPPGGGGELDPIHIKAQNWVDYLAAQSQLRADTSGAKVPPGPAFMVEAVDPGTTGKAVKLTISAVHRGIPPETTTLTLEVTAVNTYTGLALAAIADKIGTSPGGGTDPGLVYLDPSIPPTKMPSGSGNPLHMTGPAPAHVDVPSADPDPAFILNAREPPVGIGPGIVFDVEVTVTGADPNTDKLGLKVTWNKKVTNKTLAEHAAEFAYIVNITAPPDGFGIPAEGTVTLSGGTDPGTVDVPATPAKATVASA